MNYAKNRDASTKSLKTYYTDNTKRQSVLMKGTNMY